MVHSAGRRRVSRHPMGAPTGAGRPHGPRAPVRAYRGRRELALHLQLAEAMGKHNHRGATLMEVYRDWMDAWIEEAQSAEPLHDQDRQAVWLMATVCCRRVPRTKRDFIGTWADAVASAPSADLNRHPPI